MRKIFLGIDNGLYGAISIVNGETEEIIDVIPMPIIKNEKTEYNITALFELFSQIFHQHDDDELHIFLEKAHARPISGVKACFSTGFGYGIIQALIVSGGKGFELVEPKTWQKEIFKGLNIDDTKQVSIMFCKRKYPTFNFDEYGKQFTDGLTDATCIALYGKRKVSITPPRGRA